MEMPQFIRFYAVQTRKLAAFDEKINGCGKTAVANVAGGQMRMGYRFGAAVGFGKISAFGMRLQMEFFNPVIGIVHDLGQLRGNTGLLVGAEKLLLYLLQMRGGKRLGDVIRHGIVGFGAVDIVDVHG